MERAKVLGMKYIIAAIITFSIYGIFGTATLGNLFLISVLVIAIPYLGDLFLLHKIGNLFASVSDFVLYSLLYWGLATMFIGPSAPIPILLTSLTAAFFTAISESVLHIYILENVFDEKENPRISVQQLQTEFSKETDAQSVGKDD